MPFDPVPAETAALALLRAAAEAAAAAAEAFERRPTREQIPGPVSLFLSAATHHRRSWRAPQLTTALLRTHDADDGIVARIGLRTKGLFGRESAARARRALCAAAAETGGHALAYAQPGLAFVVPRRDPAKAQVVGDPARLRRYSQPDQAKDPEIRASREALLAALAADWPADGPLWEAPRTAGLTGHLRLNAYASLPPAVGAALSRYTEARTSGVPPTVVRAGGLLLALLPRKANLPGMALVDAVRI